MKNFIFILLSILFVDALFAQQDAQYTQYMYNTQVINPGYSGSRGMMSISLLGRVQWANFDGAPRTGTFTIDTPVGASENMGLGLSIIHDRIGPADETNVAVDYSYIIRTGYTSRLAFGIKAGVNSLNLDFTRLNIADPGDVFDSNIDNKIQPQIGTGAYYYTDKFYVGLSVPNLLQTDYFENSGINNGSSSAIVTDRIHYFFIAGYVFDLNENLKFKPAGLVKYVNGTPLQVDLSANFLINEKFTLGAAYRWSASVSAMAGFQVSNQIFIGLGYDYETTEIQNYSGGSYEAFVRFNIPNNPKKIKLPRFF